MATPRLLQFLHRAGWEFWLPLPFIAALFWVAGNFIGTQVLNRPYGSINKLQADIEMEVGMSETILSINAEIDRNRGVTTVFIRTTDSTSKNLEYEFPVVQTTQVEAAIAQKLEIPVENVHHLISYRLKD
jgi:hypothetical protein